MKYLMTLAFILCVVACTPVSTQEKPATVVPVAEAKPLGQDEVISRLSALPPQELNDGECGLFLWLKREDAPLLYFQRSSTPSALIVLDGELAVLARQSARGLIGSTFYSEQSSAKEDVTASLKIQVERDGGLRQGMKVPAGTLMLEGADGWSAVLAIAGAIGCKS